MKPPPPIDIDLANWREHAATAVDAASWTAVVPAAGRGSRLGYHLPKILYPVAGRPLLHWLLEFLTPNCRRLVFVLSSDGRAAVADVLERLVAGRYEIVVQENPSGMGDAVALALPAVTTPHVAVVWGDQVALRRSSVDACLRLHTGPLDADVTCPIVLRSDPYIHFERDGDGRICGLRQRREGDVMPERGESDTGFFCFRTDLLRQLLSTGGGAVERTGRATRESNLLPIIPLASRRGLKVVSPRIMSLEETTGINSRADAEVVEAFLRRDRERGEH
jgi:bifunctional UDP-N-acetylglucosamine pyrophosphorylase / glucosamine-1-phosphate N-acetyltransferase